MQRSLTASVALVGESMIEWDLGKAEENMRLLWNSTTEQWMTEASAYTGYDRNLAQLLLKHIPCRDSLCDIGCGLGLVDFELAKEIRQITCVDASDYVISSIERRTKEQGISNICAQCGKGEELKGEWQTVMALFHGALDSILVPYLSMAQDRLIYVTHGSPHGQTGPEGYRIRKCSDIAAAVAWLDANRIVYTLETASLEYGQPHRSMEEAVSFHRTFSNGAPEELLIDHVRKTVIETGRTDFPYYTPKKRDFGLFEITKEANQEILLSKGE